MRKEHKVKLNNTSDEYKVVNIPDSYGYAVLKPGETEIEIPYDDKYGLTGEEKVAKLLDYHKDIKLVGDAIILMKVNETAPADKGKAKVVEGDEKTEETQNQEADKVALTKEMLEGLSDEELKAKAKEVGVEGYNRYTRRDSLISAILSK